MASEERPGNVSGLIARLQREGVGPTAALRTYRQAGGSIRTQSWFRAWAQVADAVERGGRATQAPTGRRPVADEVAQWSTQRASGYLYQLSVQVRFRGIGEIFNLAHSVRTDRLVTYGSAATAALDVLTSDLAQYGEDVLGAIVTGVYELIPEA